ncbi:nuclear transport factor 2 family protein [Dyadobacter aurulentus]|uniref:nuclear transport factor 2 family protein n=1 Tax=Dyadobacter sp. UC 10 TaxID=2605428 RepID=UPI0011F307D4|nr:nuclear transport factor 2 family protein [Dyadobacter sp. UC 10]KAA0990213.1 nuclear transport factor 2 family protein [Dyadobacter sp. UC 10]
MKSNLLQCILAISVSALLNFKSTPANAQDQTSEVRATIDKLFDGMRAGDSLMLQSVFAKDCALTSISKNEADSLIVRTSGIQGFIKAVGTPHKDKWDEKIYDVKVSIDEPMAIVWAPYKFHLGDKFSHCGVNVFTLLHSKTGWKITGITDTRRKEACP